MILVVDFLRYWLHRAAHENKYLWQLHSVHHSVEQLYWLNTARFHPLEKALQMSLDSLPFLLMAVDERVLALYYIAYATNGFFQHSNIRLRFGVLNYVIGSAELHRWHHSRKPKESNANYGNNVIIWDLLFGTWYLPKDRDIQALGLQDRRYPRSFLAQMRAPFTL
jgi:sterol desaturase/sphingolipid hydroxylase (fatty acid hydroxylase superfamily)